MVKLWICLALTASISSVAFADSSEEDDGWYGDYYIDNEDIFQQLREHITTLADTNYDIPIHKQEDYDPASEIFDYDDKKKFEEELEKILMKDKTDDKSDDNFDDYQFEDNRSEVDNVSDDGTSKIRPLMGEIFDVDNKDENTQKNTESSDGSSKHEEADRKILEETKSILSEDTSNDFASDKTFEENLGAADNSDIFEETSKILEESYNSMEDRIEKDNNNGGEELNSVSESEEDFVRNVTKTEEALEKGEEDTEDKAYEEAINDLRRLHRTWNRLGDNEDSNYVGSDEKNIEIESLDDYEDIDDAELGKVFADNTKSDEDNDKKLLDDVLASSTQAETKTYKPLPYINDALVASDVDQSLPTSTIATMEAYGTTDTFIQEPVSQTETAETTPQPQIGVKSSLDEDIAMMEFARQHQSALDVKASDIRNAVNLWLTVDTPLEVTSPDYPQPYPTNNTVDWMFAGDGVGIELNITDFSVNGHLGDYVLVKPGGVDETGSTGIIFTYNLRSERRYRFLDVDKMFVRFVANPGNQFMRGFKFSARMVVPRPDAQLEPEPEPEREIPAPPAALTINLGGISLARFLQVEEQFRVILADMATLYINSNGIDPGLNTTLESAQILSRALCFHNWPQFELCTEVRFGVPLVYENKTTEEEEGRLNHQDLLAMWNSYSQRDPFATRLRILGITEYQIPDDAGVMTLWLAVAAGVVVSAALLALALWRFSCFEDYTRMPLMGDTDSLTEKRTLDLYPTPHQTLPPLFETDYKWSGNTDGHRDGGFANHSFLRDERDVYRTPAERAEARNGHYGFTPRDIYDA